MYTVTIFGIVLIAASLAELKALIASTTKEHCFVN